MTNTRDGNRVGSFPTRPEISCRRSSLWLFVLWLLVFYVVWITVVLWGGHTQLVTRHWPIALAMALGSYVAGSTPMGGGTVGFPVLVLLFDQSAAMGRNFALAVQSIGMVSASVYILARGHSLEWGLLKFAMVGSLVSTPLAAVFIAPFAAELTVKLTFSVIWASFGMLHLAKLREITRFSGVATTKYHLDREIGLTIGILGGVVASVVGVGIDMVLYAVLTLLYRCDLRISIPTSVVLMAFTSVIGIATNVALSQFFPLTYRIEPEVLANWLAAAPVVALGAPVGALAVQYLRRGPTLTIVSILCIAQFIWTCIHEQVAGWTLIAALTAILIVNFLFIGLYAAGRRLAHAAPGTVLPQLDVEP